MIFETPPDDRRLSHDALIAREAERMRNAGAKRAERARKAKASGPKRRHGGKRK